MCGTCGCSSKEQQTTIKIPGESNPLEHHHHNEDHHHHNHMHDHDHNHRHKTVVDLEQDILYHNKMMAARNRGYFEAKQIFTINLVSSPGSGKTSVLERTLQDLRDQIPFYVIEGDQQSMNDANRIDALDIPVVQINTGKSCHLESDLVHDAVKKLQVKNQSILMIENVGNLVCPSLFDLGETKRVVIISTTEGEDKPVKYPDMFSTSDICIINKIDLLPYLNVDIDTLKAYARRVNPHLKFFEISATTGAGMDNWYDWLKVEHHQLQNH
jgi:hydrogenase nickel incorporation protein HypB